MGHRAQYYSSTSLFEEDLNPSTSAGAVAIQDELPTPQAVGDLSDKDNSDSDNDGMENLQKALPEEKVEESDYSDEGGLENSEAGELMDEDWSDEDENDGYHTTFKF